MLPLKHSLQTPFDLFVGGFVYLGFFFVFFVFVVFFLLFATYFHSTKSTLPPLGHHSPHWASPSALLNPTPYAHLKSCTRDNLHNTHTNKHVCYVVLVIVPWWFQIDYSPQYLNPSWNWPSGGGYSLSSCGSKWGFCLEYIARMDLLVMCQWKVGYQFELFYQLINSKNMFNNQSTHVMFVISETDILLLKDEPNPKCFARADVDFTCFFETADNRTYVFFYTAVDRFVIVIIIVIVCYVLH